MATGIPNRRMWLLWAVAGLLLASAAGLAMLRLQGGAGFGEAINALGLDLARPDAYIRTPALSRLPRDLVKAPVARDLITEDFAFYYEDHEDRLGLRGALRRMAFEHRTTLTDQLIQVALDQPAEVALWADAKGAPRHWLVAMTRGVLARALQQLAPLAAQDRQLSAIAELRLNGAPVTFYALVLSPRRTLVIASQGERVLVLSDPGLLFDAQRQADAAASRVVAELLSGQAHAQSVYRRGFGLGEAGAGAGHTLVADARLLSFGYQHFFPALRALRLELGLDGVSLATSLRMQGALPPAAAAGPLWQALPFDPAACALLPADWARARAVLAPAGGASQAASAPSPAPAAWTALADELDGPAAVCWYARSQLHTPVFVARTRSDGPTAAAALESLSRWLWPAQASATEAPPVRADSRQWPYMVAAPWGPARGAEPAGYRPTIARQGRWVTFSPDDALVAQALDTQARRYPGVSEGWPEGPATLAVLVPQQLAALVRREAFAVLEPGQELFRQAAERRLVPRLEALRKLPGVRAVPRGEPDAQGWLGIDWLPLPGAAAGGK